MSNTILRLRDKNHIVVATTDNAHDMTVIANAYQQRYSQGMYVEVLTVRYPNTPLPVDQLITVQDLMRSYP